MDVKGFPCKVAPVRSVAELKGYDALVLVATSLDDASLKEFLPVLKQLQDVSKFDKQVEKEVSVHVTKDFPTSRVVFSPTGPVNRDQDDVRRFADATAAGIKRALKAGCKRLCLCVSPHPLYPTADTVGVLGAFQSLYVPLEVRESDASKASKADELGVYTGVNRALEAELQYLVALEAGRVVCRDIGGSDPERMSPQRVEEYVRGLFSSSSHINIQVVSNDTQPGTLEKEYPLFSAVNRCASVVDRHRGRVIHLEYTGEGEVKEVVGLVGKGVTYDTGGADIKAGGVMAGMHRDKCGAAAVAGLFQFLLAYRPRGVRVVGMLGMVRNSVGSNCYVADEIITSRAGVRVRVGNTDAEGRMVMADPLAHMKEKMLEAGAGSGHIYTVATLTGHAIRAVGPNYTIVIDNGAARKVGHAKEFQAGGELMGEPVEISTLRRDDYDFCQGPSEYEDLLQCNNQPSSATPRGHQFPAAFMLCAAGLDKHGIDSNKPIAYSHLDIAGSSGPFPGVPTGAPIVALAQKHFKNKK